MTKSPEEMTIEELQAELRRLHTCEICEREYPNLVVDHDHITGEIRGSLCNGCNLGLGHFKDDPTILERALRYLQRSPREVRRNALAEHLAKFAVA